MSEEFELDTELGFEPAVSATGREPEADDAPAAELRPKGRARPTLRRVRAMGVVAAALFCMGGAYAAFATSSGASNNSSDGNDVAAGRQLFLTACITCHGANLQGVQGRGPSLIAVGGASVYFQVSTGRMPATGQGAEELRKTAKFNETQTEQLAAYVQSIAGGPQVPTGNLRSKNIGAGGSLFRLNCAQCHGVTGKGAPLSAGKVAPGLNEATDKQFYTAMLSGPESMPIFSNNTLSPEQKKEIISYIQTLKASKDPGGAGIDRIGPVSEALVIWVGGVGALMIAILWIGAKAQ
jgi:ubiquinol-cytochrome c reductase cytochrome c subunit